jgi:hypothetical protein
MSDRPAPDTEPCPTTSPDHDAPEPSLRQVLERIELLASLASDTRDAVHGLRGEIASLREDVQAARHAAAVAADGALEGRAAVSRTLERLDLIDADGCGRYRAHVRSGNGGGG